MIHCFYVEVETNERHVNAPSADDIASCVRTELIGPAPENYGILRVRVGNTQWTDETGTVKIDGGFVGADLVRSARALTNELVPLQDVMGQPLTVRDRARFYDRLTEMRAALARSEVR